jgi:hypothetical protein
MSTMDAVDSELLTALVGRRPFQMGRAAVDELPRGADELGGRAGSRLRNVRRLRIRWRIEIERALCLQHTSQPSVTSSESLRNSETSG